MRKSTQFLSHTANDLLNKCEMLVSISVIGIRNKSPDIVCSKANEYFSKGLIKKGFLAEESYSANRGQARYYRMKKPMVSFMTNVISQTERLTLLTFC